MARILRMLLFLSTPSARRATTTDLSDWQSSTNFYPRPPRGGRPTDLSDWQSSMNFYPRPPRGGRHATRFPVRGVMIFLSTPSARRATQAHQAEHKGQSISIHALREEGDRRQRYICHSRSDFYPRPPRGGRQITLGDLVFALRISIHALREEGDHWRRGKKPNQRYFYPRPPRGGRHFFAV